MSSALNSVFGGGNILGAVLNVASFAFPPLGLATSAANLLTSGVGQSVMQAASQLIKECGMPKFIGDILGDVVKEVMKDLCKPSDSACDDAVKDKCGGTINDIIGDLTRQIFDSVRKNMDQCNEGGGNGGCSKGGGKSKGGSLSWMEAIAKAMGEAAGTKAEKLVKLSHDLNAIATRDHGGLEGDALKNAQAQDAKDQAAVNAQFQAASQEFNMLQSAFSNAIKSIGEGMATMARKG